MGVLKSLHFTNILIVRLPRFPVDNYDNHLQHALDNPDLRAAIYLASPVFYDRLLKSAFQISALTERELLTLHKYLNRICFRPTPFGLFASVSMCQWGKKNSLLVPATSLKTSLKPDEYFTQTIRSRCLKENPEFYRYIPNPTLYRVREDYRFIRSEILQDEKRYYQLQSTDYSLLLKQILQYCEHGCSASALISKIIDLARCELSESEEHLRFLIDSQIIIPELRPTITGEDYLSDLFDPSPTVLPEPSLKTELKTLFDAMAEQQQQDDEYYRSLNKRLISMMPLSLQGRGQQLLNLVLFRKLPQATLDTKIQLRILEALFALNAISMPDQHPQVNRFVTLFRKHFDGQRVPLMLALDPEHGIAYQDPTPASPNPLLKTIRLVPPINHTLKINWTNVHTYLTRCWLDMERAGLNTIQLAEEDLEKLVEPNDDFATLGLPVIFRICGEKLYLEQAGGNNVFSLLGRFTVGDKKLACAARLVAREEERRYPNVLFAELLHLTDPHTDNINRRMGLWSYTIPITAASRDNDDAYIISLDDLYVELSGDQVYLWSQQHQKYVIPRLSSAYNHHIDQLPLFRFLADVSGQYGRTQLHFELSDYLPDQVWYPRVEYKSVILSPATWRFSETELVPLAAGASAGSDALYDNFIQTHRLPNAIVVGEGDRELVFFLDRPADKEFFFTIIRQKTAVAVKEYLAEQKESGLARDPHGNTFVNQFITFLIPSKPFNFPSSKSPDLTKSIGQVRKYLPGSDWLYLKLYTPRVGTDRLLLKIWPILKRKYPHGKIRKWFFVRYEDHAPHIRLRIKIDPLDINYLLFALKNVLEGRHEQHLVREYQLDTYSRELERYAAAGIEASELFFTGSSIFVLSYLQATRKGFPLPVYLAAIVTVKTLLDELLADPRDQLAFCEANYRSLLREFIGDKITYQLNLKFRETTGEIDTFMRKPIFGNNGVQKAYIQFGKAVRELNLHTDTRPEMRNDLLSSMIHMHLNRLFTDQQRQQEMLIYFLLYKTMITAETRTRYQKN